METTPQVTSTHNPIQRNDVIAGVSRLLWQVVVAVVPDPSSDKAEPSSQENRVLHCAMVWFEGRMVLLLSVWVRAALFSITVLTRRKFCRVPSTAIDYNIKIIER